MRAIRLSRCMRAVEMMSDDVDAAKENDDDELIDARRRQQIIRTGNVASLYSISTVMHRVEVTCLVKT